MTKEIWICRDENVLITRDTVREHWGKGHRIGMLDPRDTEYKRWVATEASA